jgi:hypothetical protein
MNSMTIVKKVISRGAAALAVAAACFAVPANAGIATGGTVPVINNVRAIGNTSLDLASDADTSTLVEFWIDNNTPGGFILDVIPTNGGFIDAAVTDTVAFTVIHVDSVGGTWGTGVAAWAQLEQATVTAATGMDTPYTSGAQTTATTNAEFAVRASWVADATMLAGYYGETITVSLTAVF